MHYTLVDPSADEESVYKSLGVDVANKRGLVGAAEAFAAYTGAKQVEVHNNEGIVIDTMYFMEGDF